MAFDREALLKKLATELAAKPEQGFCRDNAPAVETSYAHCGGGHHGHGHGSYGCGGHGHRGGYCYGYEDNEGRPGKNRR